jgi:hypothetical protein
MRSAPPTQRKQRHSDIYPSLLNRYSQALTGDHRNLVGVRLAAKDSICFANFGIESSP